MAFKLLGQTFGTWIYTDGRTSICKQPATLLYLYFIATGVVTPYVLGFVRGSQSKKRGMIAVRNETTLLCSHSLEEQAREDHRPKSKMMKWYELWWGRSLQSGNSYNSFSTGAWCLWIWICPWWMRFEATMIIDIFEWLWWSMIQIIDFSYSASLAKIMRSKFTPQISVSSTCISK
jgi:hypothetical protein